MLPDTAESRWADCSDSGRTVSADPHATLRGSERKYDMYSVAEQLLTRLRFCLPVRFVRWLDRQVSGRAIRRMDIPPEWLLEAPDGFRAEDEIDIVFGFAHP